MKIMRKILSAILLVAFASCNSQSSFKNVNAADFEKGISQPGAQIVDVRTSEEYDEKHIASALNINVNDGAFESLMNQLEKTKPLYLYCLMGSRSRKAAEWATKNGFTQVYNLEGGITTWLNSEKPVVNKLNEKTVASAGMSYDAYLKKIKESKKLLLVDFNAVWCGPCKILKPIVERLEKKYSNKLEVLPIDVDKNNEVAKTMNINGIPVLILYKQGKEVWRKMGLPQEDELEGKINEFLK